MPAQCKPRLERLFPLMCVTKHTKRIFSLRSSWEWNFFKKTCWFLALLRTEAVSKPRRKEDGVMGLF